MFPRRHDFKIDKIKSPATFGTTSCNVWNTGTSHKLLEKKMKTCLRLVPVVWKRLAETLPSAFQLGER